MLPEIALSEQWLNRFKYSFGFYHWYGIQKLEYRKKERFGIFLP